MKTLSVVIPLFNEEQTVPVLVERLKQATKNLPYDFEFVLIDDGSSDKTLENCLREAQRDTRFKIVELSRNWGHQNAYNAGLDLAGGDAAIFLDGDLEDPPELIPRLVAEWERGFEVVNAVKNSRQRSFGMILLFSLFYWLLNKISSIQIRPQAGMYFLADKVALEQLRACREVNKFYPGLRSFIGFNQAYVYYDREQRYQGQPRQNLKRLVRLALNAFFSFSFIPIRILTYTGGILLILCLTAGLSLAIIRVSGATFIRIPLSIGWTSTILCILITLSVQILFLGILGEYIARIFDQVRNRPPYIVRKVHSSVSPANGDGETS